MKKNMALARAMPSRMGVDPAAILRLLDAAEERKIGLHGLTILRRGAVVAEGWWAPYAQDQAHMLFSLSKSFTCMAVGLCVQEGLFSIEDRVVDFFPEKLTGRPCANMEKLRVRHLLTMATGHRTEPKIFDGDDWVKSFLTSYVEEEPGSAFLYNTPATYMLSAIVQKRAGLPVGDYLAPRLFEPLGIEDWQWEKCPMGIDIGGFGLYLRTGDIAKFGRLLLQKGMYRGKQLIAAAWIDQATSFQIQNTGEGDWGAGYGYQFWMCEPKGVFRGDGAFGQLCVVVPEQDLVIAVNAGVKSIQEELSLFWEFLLPGLQEDVLPEDMALQARLNERLRGLCIAPPPAGEPQTEMERRVGGAVYELSDNPAEISALSIRFEDEPALTLQYDGGQFTCPIGRGEWKLGEERPGVQEHRPFADLFQRPACAGLWEDEATYRVEIIGTRTPFHIALAITFDGSAVCVRITKNVGFDGDPLKVIGRLRHESV